MECVLHVTRSFVRRITAFIMHHIKCWWKYLFWHLVEEHWWLSHFFNYTLVLSLFSHSILFPTVILSPGKNLFVSLFLFSLAHPLRFYLKRRKFNVRKIRRKKITKQICTKRFQKHYDWKLLTNHYSICTFCFGQKTFVQPFHMYEEFS